MDARFRELQLQKEREKDIYNYQPKRLPTPKNDPKPKNRLGIVVNPPEDDDFERVLDGERNLVKKDRDDFEEMLKCY